MSKTAVTVFVCTGKDCRKAWRHVCGEAPGKWLKQRAEEAGLPYKLKVVKTECMDHCDEAACLCFVYGHAASFETDVHSDHAADRLLAALRACVEGHDVAAGRH
jgi:predicted metal-binding protein